MKYLDINLVKGCCTDSELSIVIILNESNLTKFAMGILYSCEKGYNKYVLEYNPLNFSESISVERVANRVSEQVKSLARDHGIIVYVKGFPRCIFETFFLPRDLKFNFSSSILYLEGDYGEDFEKNINCLDCMFNPNCRGIFELEKNKVKPLPLQSNMALSNYYEEEFYNFFDDDLKESAKICLNDYKNDFNYGSKKIFFREKVSEGSDSFKEGFFYRIFNLKYNFDDLFNFFHDVYGDLVLGLKDYLRESGVFVLGFEVLSDNTLRKRLYFSTESLGEVELDSLSEFVDLDLKSQNFTGLNLEISLEKIKVYETTQRFEKISILDLKQMFKDFSLENKRTFFKFLNSFMRDISNVFIKEEYDEGFLVSKKCEVHIKDNNLRIKHLGILFGYKLGFLIDKDVRSLCVELNEFTSEKILFYYSLKLPERVEEFESPSYQ